MPKAHQRYANMTPASLIKMAARIAIEHVEACGEHVSRLQCLDERIVVDKPTAPDIDHDSPRLQQPQALAVEKAAFPASRGWRAAARR
jgi:hypothetical protein